MTGLFIGAAIAGVSFWIGKWVLTMLALSPFPKLRHMIHTKPLLMVVYDIIMGMFATAVFGIAGGTIAMIATVSFGACTTMYIVGLLAFNKCKTVYNSYGNNGSLYNGGGYC